MSILEVSQNERDLILVAQRSTSIEELKQLSNNPFSNVRRCVAKNRNTPKDIVDRLAFDPVTNVVYIALQNPICSVKRELSTIISRCVMCPKDESTYYYECKNCNCSF